MQHPTFPFLPGHISSKQTAFHNKRFPGQEIRTLLHNLACDRDLSSPRITSRTSVTAAPGEFAGSCRQTSRPAVSFRLQNEEQTARSLTLDPCAQARAACFALALAPFENISLSNFLFPSFHFAISTSTPRFRGHFPLVPKISWPVNRPLFGSLSSASPIRKNYFSFITKEILSFITRA